jgi:hypothetical protein
MPSYPNILKRAQKGLPLLLIVMLSSCNPRPSIIPSVEQDNDAILLEQTPNQLLVRIHSEDGIGSGTLTRTGETWPQSVTLRLFVKELEGIRLSNGSIEIASFRTDPSPTAPIITQKENWIDVEVPSALLNTHPEFLQIHWVDFYR